jgi:hypothetical protein
MFLKIVLILPVLLAVLMAVVDYNRFIQIPYWSLYSFCYIKQENGYSFCSESNLNAWSEWTKSKWNWNLESAKQFEDVAIKEFPGDMFSYEFLKKESLQFTRPVIFRGRFNDSAAVRKWSPEYFEETAGDAKIIVLTEGTVEYRAKHKLFLGAYKPAITTFRSALNRMKGGEKIYLNNVDTIFRQAKQIWNDLEISQHIKPWAFEPFEPFGAQFFLGFGSKEPKETTGTAFHSASNANLFVMAKGRKHWTFINNRFTLFLAHHLNYVSPVAILNAAPDASIPRMHADLEEGDLMFNPPWMWHEIMNQEGFTAAVATRENRQTWQWRNNFLYTFLTEFVVFPKTAQVSVPESHKFFRTVLSVPMLGFTIGYLKESIVGLTKHPVFSTMYDFTCDEHSPNGCASSFLDKNLYLPDGEDLPMLE